MPSSSTRVTVRHCFLLLAATIVATSCDGSVTEPPPPLPSLESITPSIGVRGSTIPVSLTGTGFDVGAVVVGIAGTGVAVENLVVTGPTSLSANFVIDGTAALGPRDVTVSTGAGTSGARQFTINPPSPTLVSISPSAGARGTTTTVTLMGSDFVAGATSVSVSGTGVTVSAVHITSSSELHAEFFVDGSAVLGARDVTVTTAGGTSPARTFTVEPGEAIFEFVGDVQDFVVPPGVTSITIQAIGAAGGPGSPDRVAPGGGGRVTATVAVTPLEALRVYVGGQGGQGGVNVAGAGGFNGGGVGTSANWAGGGGGGGSDVRRSPYQLTDRLVVAGGGGGGGGTNGIAIGGLGGLGGETTGEDGGTASDAGGGGGGTPTAGGSGGVGGWATGTPGGFGIGGAGGTSGNVGGGGGGGGWFGGGGGGEASLQRVGGGGGGGSSFTVPGATSVSHTRDRLRVDHGRVVISW